MDFELATPGYRVVLFITDVVVNYRTGESTVTGRINDAKKGQAAKLSVPNNNMFVILEGEGIKKRMVLVDQEKNQWADRWVDRDRHPAQVYVWLPEQVRLKGGHLLATPVKVTLLNEKVILYEQEQ